MFPRHKDGPVRGVQCDPQDLRNPGLVSSGERCCACVSPPGPTPTPRPRSLPLTSPLYPAGSPCFSRLRTSPCSSKTPSPSASLTSPSKRGFGGGGGSRPKTLLPPAWPDPLLPLRSNALDTQDPTYFKLCRYDPRSSPACPVFRIGDLVAAAGGVFEDLALLVGPRWGGRGSWRPGRTREPLGQRALYAGRGRGCPRPLGLRPGQQGCGLPAPVLLSAAGTELQLQVLPHSPPRPAGPQSPGGPLRGAGAPGPPARAPSSLHSAPPPQSCLQHSLHHTGAFLFYFFL